MEQIAIISNIHGNAPALKAVINKAHKRDINRILCLGDIIGKGPSFDIVIDICKEYCEKIKEWHKNNYGKDNEK